MNDMSFVEVSDTAVSVPTNCATEKNREMSYKNSSVRLESLNLRKWLYQNCEELGKMTVTQDKKTIKLQPSTIINHSTQRFQIWFSRTSNYYYCPKSLLTFPFQKDTFMTERTCVRYRRLHFFTKNTDVQFVDHQKLVDYRSKISSVVVVTRRYQIEHCIEAEDEPNTNAQRDRPKIQIRFDDNLP